MDTPPSWRPSWGRLAVVVALALAGGALLWLWYKAPAENHNAAVATPAAPAPAAATAYSAATPAPAAALPRMPEGDADPTRDLSSYVMRGENPSAAEVIERLHQRGIYSGLGAFPPPGTSPPLVGLAVPADFALPPGYVRHHQATDDGQPIEAILMFAPGFQLFDAANRPIDMPKNGVVPPELAPPGLPIRRISIPAAIAQAGH